MRNMLMRGDEAKNDLISNLPDHLSDIEKEQAYAILNNLSNENLNNLIDHALAEMSTMAGGSVQGTAGSFGPPNTYNSYKKSNRAKVKKPVVKKGKRQRRR